MITSEGSTKMLSFGDLGTASKNPTVLWLDPKMLNVEELYLCS